MPVIAFTHHKGGTGKTTSCLNIAGALVDAGKKVLVVDCDPQANATMGLGIFPDSQKQNMYDVFMGIFEGFPEVPLREIIIPTESGIDLAPSNLDLVGVEPPLYTLDERATVLKELLAPVVGGYDYILIDTPPSMGQFVINGLVASDHIIITLDAGIFALRGIDALEAIFSDIESMVGKKVSPEMAILTRWRSETSEPEVLEQNVGFFTALARRLFKAQESVPTADQIRVKREKDQERERMLRMEMVVRKKFKQVYTVPFQPEVYEAQQRGLPLSQFAPDTDATRAYKKITDEVMRWR
jgi:chromosome partitioning protein